MDPMETRENLERLELQEFRAKKELQANLEKTEHQALVVRQALQDRKAQTPSIVHARNERRNRKHKRPNDYGHHSHSDNDFWPLISITQSLLQFS